MEVIEYVYPTKWDDKGMDWDNPDPGKADYVMAIRQAIMERAAAVHMQLRFSSYSFRVSPMKAVSRSMVEEFVDVIAQLAPEFVNMGFKDYKEDLSDFPKMWTYADLVKEEGCELYEWAAPCAILKDGGKWLKAMKNALNKLTVIKCHDINGTRYSRSGSKHDPPFDESIGTALEEAMKVKVEAKFRSFPVSASSWSGNTHWCCPRKEDEHSYNGYCGYAESRAYALKSVGNWLNGSEFDLLFAAKVSRPSGPVPYSQILDASVFDPAGSGFKEGVGFLEPKHIKDASDLDIALGDADTIPKNSNVPSSEFDDEGTAVVRHSTKIGYEAEIWGLMDYGVENGFKFREEN